MKTGYSIYLVYSLLFWPMAHLTGRAIVIGNTENILFRVASGFAALSTLARALGIVRWLFAMLVLRVFTLTLQLPKTLKKASAWFMKC